MNPDRSLPVWKRNRGTLTSEYSGKVGEIKERHHQVPLALQGLVQSDHLAEDRQCQF